MKRVFGILGLMIMVATNSFAASKEQLTIGVAAEFENLHPLIGTQAVTSYMLNLAYRPLIVLDLKSKWKPLLIKEIPTLENKLAKRRGEGIEVTFEFVKNLKWGDGTPVTCRDVAFAWEVGKNKNVSVGNREPYENITSVTADKSSNQKCTVVFAKTKFDYFTNIPSPVPAHLEEEIFKKHSSKAEGYDVNSNYTKNPTNPGLYNGPYVVSELKLGSHLIFSRNPQFHGKKPYFDKIVFKLVPNNATFEANLRSGILDMVSPAAGLGLDQAVIFEKKVKSENLPFNVVFADGVIYAHIDLNMGNPILADLKVRQALSHAFNKKDMIDSLLEGKGKPAIHNITENDPWFSNKVTTYPYNKRLAQRLLDEAGWKMGSNGVRQKDGKNLSVVFYSAAGAKLNDMIMAYLQDKWKAIGVEVVIKTEAARVFFGQTVSHRKYDMALYSWISIPESSPRSTLHSSMIPSESNSWAGQNSCGYKNPEVDKLIDALETELNASKRKAIAQKILQHYTKDIPVIPIYYRPNTSVIPKGMKGYQLSGHLFYETLYAENWSL